MNGWPVFTYRLVPTYDFKQAYYLRWNLGQIELGRYFEKIQQLCHREDSPYKCQNTDLDEKSICVRC